VLTRSLVKPLTKATSDSRPVYIVAGNGGHVLQFRALAGGLLPNWQLNGLLYPIFAGSNARYSSIQDLSDAMLHAVVSERGPIVLIGYSMGGAIAYEMACKLKEHGHDAAVVMIDTSVPALRKKYSRPARTMRNWLALRPVKRWYRKYRKSNKLISGPNRDNINTFVAENRLAVRSYEPSKSNVPIALVRAIPARRIGWISKDYWPSRDHGWSKVSTEVIVIDCTGGHRSIWRPTLLGGLTRAVSEAVDIVYPVANKDR
jgi:thioesterase domain-containing protein